MLINKTKTPTITMELQNSLQPFMSVDPFLVEALNNPRHRLTSYFLFVFPIYYCLSTLSVSYLLFLDLHALFHSSYPQFSTFCFSHLFIVSGSSCLNAITPHFQLSFKTVIQLNISSCFKTACFGLHLFITNPKHIQHAFFFYMFLIFIHFLF